MKFTDSLKFKIVFAGFMLGIVIIVPLSVLSWQISNNLDASNEQIKLVQKQEESAKSQVTWVGVNA